MKKLLLLAIGIFLNTSGYAYDFEKDGIYYNITSLQDLTVEVTSGDNNYEGDVTIPDKVVYSGRTFIVTRIGENAFLSSSITGIGIPLSVVTVGKYAFRNCKQLRNILIPSSITTFEPGAFGGCNNLNNVVIEDGESGLSMPYNEWQVMNMSYFSNCNIQTLYYGRNVSYSRYDYYDGLFWNQGNLKSVEIGPMVIRLEANLFRGCKGLEIIEIPSNVKIIGNSTFEDCSSLQDIIINEGLQEISSMAFKNCKSIEKISLPGSLTRINSEAFVGCTGITKVYSMVKEPFDIAESTFAGITYLNSTLYVPTGTKSLYQERTGWKDFISIVETDDFEEIPDIPEKPKCATPTISYENWNIKFECETEGAQIVSEVKPTDLKSSTDIEVGLTPTYVITAYAIAEGYHKSDVATATISWRYGRPVIIQGFSNVNLDETTSVCDVNNDGTVDVADIATIIDKMATSARLQNEMKE